MPLYRKRLRSITGCSACRRGHKKCDEQRPTCGRCKRLDISCPFSRSASALKCQSVLVTTSSRCPGAKGGSEMVLTVVPPVLQPNVAVGYSKDIHSVLQYHQIHQMRLSQRAGSCSFSSLLSILPAASSYPMLLAALATVLTILMPGEWSPKSVVVLRLSNSAIHGILDAIAMTESSETIDCTILSAILLHLCDIHTYPEPTRRFLHLRGAHGLLKRRLSLDVKASAFLIQTISPLVYHEVISSTVNHKLLAAGISPSYIDQVSKFCTNRVSGDVPKVEYLGVPVACLSVILKLACSRSEILRGKVSQATLLEVIDAKDVLRQIDLTPVESIARTIEVLHVYACLFFRQMLLENVGSVPKDDETRPIPEQDDKVFQVVLSSIGSYQLAPHVFTWPLLVIGLAVQSTTQRVQIRECVEHLVHDSCLASAQGVLKTLDHAWTTGAGLSVLLSSDLDTTLMF